MPWKYLFELNAARARTFRDAPDDGGGAAPAGEEEQAATADPVTLTFSPEQVAAMGLAPEATNADAVVSMIAAGKELAATLAEVQGKLGTMEAAEQQRLAAELDKELADYDLDEETSGVIRTLSPEQRKPLLGKMPKKPVAAPAADAAPATAVKPAAGAAGAAMPPKPVHDPKGAASEQAGMTPEQKASESEALIKTVQKESRFKDYTSAREEARRRKPELFS